LLQKHILRWRYPVLAVQIGVAVGCGVAAWRVVPRATTTVTGVVHHALAPPAPQETALMLPWAHGASGAGVTVHGARDLTGALLRTTNVADARLHQEQWRVINALLDAIHRYVEQRIMPELLGSSH
jgi:hypothetical protein